MPGPRDHLVHGAHEQDLSGRPRDRGVDALPQKLPDGLSGYEEAAGEIDLENSAPLLRLISAKGGSL